MTAHRAQTALAGWLAFAGYAAVVTAVAQGPESAWGAWAAGGYGLGALAALRSRGPGVPVLAGLSGAVIAPHDLAGHPLARKRLRERGGQSGIPPAPPREPVPAAGPPCVRGLV